MKFLQVALPLLLTLSTAHADCMSKYAKLMENETNEDKLYALDRQFIACKKGEKQSPNTYVGNSATGAATKNVPGLSMMLKNERLVMTHTESSCDSGKCRAAAYITRSSYPKHRPGDSGAFCGAMASWQASEKGSRLWEPANELAYSIAENDSALALQIIDSKQKSYCR